MTEIQVNSEKELLNELLQSRVYEEFRSRQLQAKVEREKRARRLLEEHKGRFDREKLNEVFDAVDLFEGNKRWFGALLATPNRNLILGSEPELINRWFDALLFCGNEPETALNMCLKNLKIKGASKGLATLLLYLTAPDKFNVWVNATQEGLSILGRIGDLRGTDWGNNHAQFN